MRYVWAVVLVKNEPTLKKMTSPKYDIDIGECTSLHIDLFADEGISGQDV